LQQYRFDAVPKLHFNKGNYSDLRDYLINWDLLLKPYTGDIETMWNIIKDKILIGVTMYIPSTLPFALWKKDKWKRPLALDTEIRNMINVTVAL